MALTLCRSRFTSQDFQFVLDRLSDHPRQTESLQSLCQDPTSFNQILDLEPLHRSLVDEPRCVGVSPAFYFYVLTRRELLRHVLVDHHPVINRWGPHNVAIRHEQRVVGERQTRHGAQNGLAGAVHFGVELRLANHQPRGLPRGEPHGVLAEAGCGCQ